MESDAKKVAKRAYEIEQVSKTLGDRSNIHGSLESREQQIREYMDYANKMLEKYGKDHKQSEQFNKRVKQEIEKIRVQNEN
jgi:ABC-type transporter Mla subunit MlaD